MNKEKNYNIFQDEEILNITYEDDKLRKKQLVTVLKEINKLELPMLDLISKIFVFIIFGVQIVILYKLYGQ